VVGDGAEYASQWDGRAGKEGGLGECQQRDVDRGGRECRTPCVRPITRSDALVQNEAAQYRRLRGMNATVCVVGNSAACHNQHGGARQRCNERKHARTGGDDVRSLYRNVRVIPPTLSAKTRYHIQERSNAAPVRRVRSAGGRRGYTNRVGAK